MPAMTTQHDAAIDAASSSHRKLNNWISSAMDAPLGPLSATPAPSDEVARLREALENLARVADTARANVTKAAPTLAGYFTALTLCTQEARAALGPEVGEG